jgi:hypothetical protein
MASGTALVRVAAPLRFLLPARHRHGEVLAPVDGTASVGHVVQALGVPRTEVGALLVAGAPAPWSRRALDADVVDVLPVTRPQPVAEHRYVLDVHFGTLARRMRLLGIDTAYRNDASDPELVEQAIAERRIVLTQDRGLLRRRALPAGAFIGGSDPDDQLADVLDRFAPPIAPWTRCSACNGLLAPAERAEIEHLVEPGTLTLTTDFARCVDCGQPYWRGAHAPHLDAIVATALVR